MAGHPALQEVDGQTKNVAIKLFSSTWKKNATGIGRDAVGLSHKSLKITHVFCIRASRLKQNYTKKLANSEHSLEENIYEDLRKSPIQTREILKNTEILEWKTQLNEALLFHGTARENVIPIVENGFD